MARQPARAARIYWDEHKISGYLNQAGMNLEQELPDITSFEDDGPRVITADYGYSFNVTGFNDYVDNLIDEILHADHLDGADHYLALCPLNTSGIPTENTPAYEGVVQMRTRPLQIQAPNAQMFTFEAGGANGLSRATVLRSATVSAVANGTGRELGATTAGQTFAATIRVISGTFTSITVAIQESQNDGSPDAYAAISGMSATLSAAGVSRVTTTAATEAWKRVAVTAFTGTSCVLLVTAGLVAGT